MLGHPRQGVERVRGRIDRRRDRRELAALGRPPSEHYKAVSDWSQVLHKAIDAPWPCQEAHHEIGVAVPEDLRSRWTYVAGTSRQRLPGLVRDLRRVDLFVHDSLHTARNTCFELGTIWPALGPGGAAVVDDIDHSLGFSRFTARVAPSDCIAARHVTGSGVWGIAIKAGSPAQAPPATQSRPAPGVIHATRERRHQRIEDGVVNEIARTIKALAPTGRRLLQIQPGRGLQTLTFRDQLGGGCRPVIYDGEDVRDPAVSAVTEFHQVDIEAAAFPAADGDFDLVIWNRELTTVKNVGPALREALRVLRPGAVLVVAVPNLAALHNRLLLLAGPQPTTLHVGRGDHVRGFTVRSMTGFLTRDLGLDLLQVTGVGLAPVSAAVLPAPLRGISHTVVWALRKRA